MLYLLLHYVCMFSFDAFFDFNSKYHANKQTKPVMGCVCFNIPSTSAIQATLDM